MTPRNRPAAPRQQRWNYPLCLTLLGLTLGNAMFAAYPPTRAFAAAPAGMVLVLAASAASGPVVAQFRSDLLASLAALLPVIGLAAVVYTAWTFLALRLAHQAGWWDLVSLAVAQRLVLLTMIAAATGTISGTVSTAVWPKARWSPNDRG